MVATNLLLLFLFMSDLGQFGQWSPRYVYYLVPLFSLMFPICPITVSNIMFIECTHAPLFTPLGTLPGVPAPRLLLPS